MCDDDDDDAAAELVGLCIDAAGAADAMCGKNADPGLCAPGPPSLRLCGLRLCRMGCGLRGPAIPEYAYCSKAVLMTAHGEAGGTGRIAEAEENNERPARVTVVMHSDVLSCQG